MNGKAKMFDMTEIEKRILASVDVNVDWHRETAAQLFDIKPEQVTDSQRRIAKTFNYRRMYGGVQSHHEQFVIMFNDFPEEVLEPGTTWEQADKRALEVKTAHYVKTYGPGWRNLTLAQFTPVYVTARLVKTWSPEDMT